MGLTVTQLAYAFGGSNPSLPTPFRHQECGSSSVDRALAFQAKGRGFEPRLPLYADLASYKMRVSLRCASCFLYHPKHVPPRLVLVYMGGI